MKKAYDFDFVTIHGEKYLRCTYPEWRQSRPHRKKRINKKWRKYGMREVLQDYFICLNPERLSLQRVGNAVPRPMEFRWKYDNPFSCSDYEFRYGSYLMSPTSFELSPMLLCD